MGQITPVYPVVNGNTNQWGPILNTLLSSVVTQGNASDAIVGALTETIQDTVAAMFLGNGITFVYNDDTGKITATVNVTTPTPALTNTAAPGITGTAQSGNVVTASIGSWSPTPDSYSYQWRRNGTAITGATGANYTLTNADVSTQITVLVTVSKTGYVDTYASSAAITPVAGTSTVVLALTEGGDLITTETGDFFLVA